MAEDLVQSYQSNRWIDRTHAIVQFVLVFLILGAANYIAMNHYKRVDLTENRQFTLSAVTLAYLEKLDRPVDVVVTLTEGSNDPFHNEMLKDIKALLREFEFVTRDKGANRVKVEYLDVYQQTRRAQDLGIEQENIIVFRSGSTPPRTVFLNELYSGRTDESREFLGENVFIRSILELSEADHPKLYFTTGHGELSLTDFSAGRGASQLFDELDLNFDIRTIDLTSPEPIPDDAAMVIMAGPQTRCLPQEQEALKTYLNKKSGRVMVLLEPEAGHGLDDLFYDWGILTDDVVVIENDRNRRTQGGDLMIKSYHASHQVTKELAKHYLPLVSDRTRSVRKDPGRPIDDSLKVTELMRTSENSWGEKSYRESYQLNASPPKFDETVDLRPPIMVAAIAERNVVSSLGISIPGGKLLVIGTSNFVSNNHIHSLGNLPFFLNATNYMVDRMASLNIPSRRIEKSKLDLSLEQLLISRHLIWLGPPMLVGLIGLSVYLARRN